MGRLGGSVGGASGFGSGYALSAPEFPASGSVLTARSLELVSDSVSPSLSLALPCSLCLSLSLKKK